MIRVVGLLLILVVVGGGAFLGVRLWLAPPAQEVEDRMRVEPAVIEEKGVRVVVPKRRLASGTLIKQSDLRWQEWPIEERLAEDYLVEGQVTLESLEGAVVRQWLAEGDPVAEAHLVYPGARGLLASVLRPGYRAVTIAVDKKNLTLGGLTFPGDHIDLVLSYEINDKMNATKRWATMTVLTDIRVLAVDQLTAAQMEESESPKGPPKTVTLEVTPKQAEIVVQATRMGTLSLALRSLPPGMDRVKHINFANEPPAGAIAGGDPTLDSDVNPRLHALLEEPVLEEPAPEEPAPIPHHIQVVRGENSVIRYFERDHAGTYHDPPGNRHPETDE
ncbi:MAG: Flp pilus assembly protein CpaB [Gammaproteobacteria bacterium]|nr:Flp pilus assembly protein CpaB [Gammaproteobacteria bacterium]